jgi:hypothetical protein
MSIVVGNSRFRKGTPASAIYKTKGAGELIDGDNITIPHTDDAVPDRGYTWNPAEGTPALEISVYGVASSQ